MIAGIPLHRSTALAALTVVAACRGGFDPRLQDAAPPDAIADASPDTPTDACTLGAWSKPILQPFANVNTPDATEWGVEISGDGLRLVFSTDRIDQDKQTTDYDLYMAQRASLSEPFDRPRRLAISAENETDADPTLTEDARELYFVSTRDSGECIYAATRPDTTRDWDTVRRLDALCSGVIPSGPYISRDGLRLYYEASGAIQMASREARGDPFPAGVVVGAPGLRYCALGDHELTIYCEEDVGGRAQLWRATRPSINTQFPSGAAIPELASPDADGDPSVTDDGLHLVYASTIGNSDGTSDLFIADRACQ